jgi:TolA-binding protein
LKGIGKEKEDLKIFAKLLNGKYAGFSNYYSGIINFRNEDYELAYKQFQKAALSIENINYSWNARYYSSRSASLLSKTDNAIAEAEKALRFAYNDSQTALALELLSGLYTDNKDFSKAEKMLIENSNRSGIVGMTGLYQLGIIYARQDKIEKANEAWKKFLFNFPYSDLAEEIKFRLAELSYNSKKWNDAAQQFSDFRNNYPKSSFSETAMYYQTEAIKNLSSENKQNENRALMLYQNYLKLYPDGMFRYQCYEESLKIFYKREEYRKALDCAENILRFFPNQIGNEKILKQKNELLRLVNDSNVNDPDYFLANAEKYAKAGEAENAAYSMYCAVEAFMNSGRTEDAKETLQSMKKIFPSSEWTVNAENLILKGKQ